MNNKHSVFGKVVGGFEVLTLMEKIATDDEDRPVQDIEITGATVFVNPYTDLIEEEKEKKKKAEVAEKKKMVKNNSSGQYVQGTEGQLGAWFSDPGAAGGSSGGGVGKYLKNVTTTAAAGGSSDVAAAPAAKKAKTSAGAPLANFDAW